MKKLTKILSLFLALTMLLCFPVAVSAAELEDAPIDESKTGSLTIYKYDLTNAEKDGVWDSSYVSTGVFDQTGVNDVLGGSGAALGNGETGYGYAIKGVEFSYVKVADIVTFSESEADSRTDRRGNHPVRIRKAHFLLRKDYRLYQQNPFIFQNLGGNQMKYVKPELKIEKFSIIEDITADGESSTIPPWFIDENNGGNGDISLENAFIEAIGNVFDF